MSKITLCLGFVGSILQTGESQHFEDSYACIYRTLASILYANAALPFSLHFSGALIEWLQKQHPEFFMTIEEMTARKQVEMIGGGYNEPLFPLIPPSDRVGQIELLTTALRKLTGKRPRGAWLVGSAWEPSFISSCNTCGIEYVLLDSRLITGEIHDNMTKYEPVIVEDIGKTLYVLPLNGDFFINPAQPGMCKDPDEIIAQLHHIAQTNSHAVINCFFSNDMISALCTPYKQSTWLEEFFKRVADEDYIELSTPLKCIKKSYPVKRTFIPSGAVPAIAGEEDSFFMYSSIRHFLLLYPESLALYSRMMYTHSLVSQIQGDRARKRTALEEIWKSQASDAYWFVESDGIYNQHMRQKSYKHLLQAEKIIRECADVRESLISLDFDFDGIKEYISQFPLLDIYVHTRGGTIVELDILPPARNYTDTMLRIEEFDGVTDTYARKMCIDHLIDENCLESLLKRNLPAQDSLFPTLMYQETHFDRVRRILSLKAVGNTGELHQQVSLKKNYSFSADGVQVQYILKNESPLPLSRYFAVESNLSLSGMSQEQQSIEIISGDEKKDTSLCEQQYNAVSYVQINDIQNGVQFTFEPNENAFASLIPLYICRPIRQIDEHNGYSEKTETVYQATNLLLYWKVDLSPGYEMEKTVFFKLKVKKNSHK